MVAGKKVFVYAVRGQEADRFVLVFASHDEPGWEVPKGSIEPGESPSDAVFRELGEETGLSREHLSPVILLGTKPHLEEQQSFFVVRLRSNAPWAFENTTTGHGIDAGLVVRFRWLPIEPRLSELLVQGCGAMVDALIKAVFPTSQSAG
ncbi:NUDIX domain-containing protein [Candidatus Bipolaricaulota bacterium]|nr:NUDIX domain-containing protein [Candidatus Bipolaricaulota bacterium]